MSYYNTFFIEIMGSHCFKSVLRECSLNSELHFLFPIDLHYTIALTITITSLEKTGSWFALSETWAEFYFWHYSHSNGFKIVSYLHFVLLILSCCLVSMPRDCLSWSVKQKHMVNLKLMCWRRISVKEVKKHCKYGLRSVGLRTKAFCSQILHFYLIIWTMRKNKVRKQAQQVSFICQCSTVLSFFCRMSVSRRCLCCVKYLMFVFNLIFWVSI